MKNTPAWVVLAVIAISAFVLFSAFVYGLKKTFRAPPPPPTSDSMRMLREQREKNAELLEQQKILTEQRQQRLRDMQQR